jgi:DNA polymerase-3 subunit alpha
MLEGFEVRRVPHQEIYKKRLMEEYNLICEKGFASYFLIQKMMVDEARRIAPELLGWGDGSEAVGPGRGSVCGSLLAYCIGLHDIDPIRHNLLFSRFLSPARGGLQMKTRFNKEPIYIDQKVA